MTADGLIKAGFWTQLVLLALMDWASISAFMTQDVAWYHYAGFVVVNTVLLALTAIMWKWLKPQRKGADG